MVDTNIGLINQYIFNDRGTVTGFGDTVINFYDPSTGLPGATDNAIVRFNGIDGQIQDSGVILDDGNNITGV